MIFIQKINQAIRIWWRQPLPSLHTRIRKHTTQSRPSRMQITSTDHILQCPFPSPSLPTAIFLQHSSFDLISGNPLILCWVVGICGGDGEFDSWQHIAVGFYVGVENSSWLQSFNIKLKKNCQTSVSLSRPGMDSFLTTERNQCRGVFYHFRFFSKY